MWYLQEQFLLNVYYVTVIVCFPIYCLIEWLEGEDIYASDIVLMIVMSLIPVMNVFIIPFAFGKYLKDPLIIARKR